MAKKIRFALEMKDGAEVRTIEELRETFSLEKALFYLSNGKLVTWLRDRYLDDLAEAVEALEADSDNLPEKLCEIFDVEYDKEAMENLEKAAEINRKKELLKNYTTEDKYFEVVEKIAFDQDELHDLLDNGENTIYLCGEKFSVPISKTGVTYIGVNKPMVVINSKEIVNFDEKNISFKNIVFDETYQELLKSAEEADEEKIDCIKRMIAILRNYSANGKKDNEKEEADKDSLEGIDKALYLLGQFTVSGKKCIELGDKFDEMAKRGDWSASGAMNLWFNAIKFDIAEVLDILDNLDAETKKNNNMLIAKIIGLINPSDYKENVEDAVSDCMKDCKEMGIMSPLAITMAGPLGEARELLRKMQNETGFRDAGDRDKIKQVLKTFEEYMEPKERIVSLSNPDITVNMDDMSDHFCESKYEAREKGESNLKEVYDKIKTYFDASSDDSYAEKATEDFFERINNHVLEVLQIINNLDDETHSKNKNKIQLVLEILKDLRQSIRNVANIEIKNYFDKLNDWSYYKNKIEYDHFDYQDTYSFNAMDAYCELSDFGYTYNEKYEKSVSNCFKEQIIAPIVDLLNRIK